MNSLLKKIQCHKIKEYIMKKWFCLRHNAFSYNTIFKKLVSSTENLVSLIYQCILSVLFPKEKLHLICHRSAITGVINKYIKRIKQYRKQCILQRLHEVLSTYLMSRLEQRAY